MVRQISVILTKILMKISNEVMILVVVIIIVSYK